MYSDQSERKKTEMKPKVNQNTNLLPILITVELFKNKSENE